MSGAQGALPPGVRTDTTYEIAPGHVAVKENAHSKEDSKGVEVVMGADHSPDAANAAGQGGPVFGDPDKKSDLGVAGTA